MSTLSKDPDAPHAASEHLALRQHLVNHFGLTQAQCDAAVDAAPNGKTRRETEHRLRRWLVALPKGA